MERLCAKEVNKSFHVVDVFVCFALLIVFFITSYVCWIEITNI
jgi:hypothetical protein